MRERIINNYGSPVQQSMTLRPADYTGLNLSRLMLGLIIDVYPADDPRNRSSFQREDRRGYLHACTVLVLQDGRGTHLPLENVIITPDAPTGIDDYYERLPRGCTGLVTGENWNNQFNHINPYDLDGDWCIVGFMGGSIDQPFIVRWWPHPRNTFDPATSGTRNPNATNESRTLVQKGRMFHRINGVEFTVTKTGNIYVSTYRASSTLNFGSDLSPVEGRFPRTLNEDVGGSFKMWIKPSQSFELDWNTPEDGIGVMDVSDDEIPQSNPNQSGSSASTTSKTNTYIYAESDRVSITVPDSFSVLSKKRLLLESEEDTKLTVGTNLTTEVSGDSSTTISGSATVSTDGSLDVDVTQDFGLTVTGQTAITANTTLDVQATADATINSQATLTLSSNGVLSVSGSSVTIGTSGLSGGPGSISVTPTGINLGTGTLGGAVGGEGLQNVLIAFAAAVQAAQALATVESAYAQALTIAANTLAASITAAISPTTKVG